jgi:hypothetical protein
MARVTPPSFTTLAAKKKAEPTLNLPPGLENVRYIRKAESIPDEYITNNYVLEQHRGVRTKVTDGIPLFKTLLEQMLATQLQTQERDYDEYDDDNGDEAEGSYVDGQEVKLQTVLNAFKNFLSSEATLSLFQSAKIYYNGRARDDNIHTVAGEVVPTEIILCKEKITYETDAVVISRLKKQVYAEITRYRRAKEKY